MTFIVYSDRLKKIFDVFPGCWEDVDDDACNIWAYYHKLTGHYVHTYCIHHHCDCNEDYKPTWYTRPEDR